MAVSKVILNGGVLIDVTQTTVEADKMVSPRTALNNAGNLITGTISADNNMAFGDYTVCRADLGRAGYMILDDTVAGMIGTAIIGLSAIPE